MRLTSSHLRIPHKVLYDGKVIRVKWEKDPRFCKKWDGEYWKGKIRIKRNMPRTWQEETFIHELIHMVDYKLHEKHVNLIAERLYEVMVENRII
jgi:hypothetical protein